MRTTPLRRREYASNLLLSAFCLLPLAIGLLTGCAAVDTSKYPRLGAPRLAPTDAAQVEVLHRLPMRQYIRLGRIRARPRGGADEQRIEAALRQAAATMGANAVVIGEERQDESGRVIDAVAIAYRQP